MKGNHEISRSKQLPTPGGTLLRQVFTVRLILLLRAFGTKQTSLQRLTNWVCQRFFHYFLISPFILCSVECFSSPLLLLAWYYIHLSLKVFSLGIILPIFLIFISFRAFLILHRIFLPFRPSFNIYLFSVSTFSTS